MLNQSEFIQLDELDLAALADDMENDSEQTQKFTIDNDSTADWALRKIAEEEKERNRVCEIGEEQIQSVLDRMDKAKKRCSQKTDYLKSLLALYFETVPHKSTKTQETYRLLSGQLVKKLGGVKPVIDDDKLLKWLRDNGKAGLIKTTEKPQWGELKKLCDLTKGDIAVIADSGEVVEGVTLETSPDTFDVKFT